MRTPRLLLQRVLGFGLGTDGILRLRLATHHDAPLLDVDPKHRNATNYPKSSADENQFSTLLHRDPIVPPIGPLRPDARRDCPPFSTGT